MNKLLIAIASASMVSFAALCATEALAHGGGGGGPHGPPTGGGPAHVASPMTSTPHAPPTSGSNRTMSNHGPLRTAGFKPGKKKGYGRDHLEAPEFGDDNDDDGDDDGCTAVMYQGRRLWACE
jgi:hypothetical protein